MPDCFILNGMLSKHFGKRKLNLANIFDISDISCIREFWEPCSNLQFTRSFLCDWRNYAEFVRLFQTKKFTQYYIEKLVANQFLGSNCIFSLITLSKTTHPPPISGHFTPREKKTLLIPSEKSSPA